MRILILFFFSAILLGCHGVEKHAIDKALELCGSEGFAVVDHLGGSYYSARCNNGAHIEYTSKMH